METQLVTASHELYRSTRCKTAGRKIPVSKDIKRIELWGVGTRSGGEGGRDATSCARDFQQVASPQYRLSRYIHTAQNKNCSMLFCSKCSQGAHYFPNAVLKHRGIEKCASERADEDDSSGPLEGLVNCVSNAMSERKVRSCPKCHLRFTKSDGCNKME